MTDLERIDISVRERALLELALKGTLAEAKRQMDRAFGKGVISEATLRQLRDECVDEIAEIAQREAPRVGALHALGSERVIARSNKVELALLDRLEENVQLLSPKDVANALRNVSTTKALNMDKIVNPIRGRGTIVEHRSAGQIQAELLAKLKRLGLIVDGEAEEIDDAEGTVELDDRAADLPSLPAGKTTD